MRIHSAHTQIDQRLCAHLRRHLPVLSKQFFQPLDVVAEAAADVDTFQHLVVVIVRSAEVGGHFSES